MKKHKKFNFIGTLIISFVILLIVYTGWDAFKVRPQIKEKVDTVSVEFKELKIYLDAKLPEIDSVLILHTDQIQEQNLQLSEINKLTQVLSEK